MTNETAPEIAFTRLTAIAPEEIIRHMSDPRVTAHMPLAKDGWDHETCAAFVRAKEACWERDGLGHWAILAEGAYVGWGGFQKEGEEWDYGLVLKPDRFGLGMRITRQAFAFAREEARIPYVTFLLPPSRRHLGGLDRLGARPVGEVDYDGSRFLKFRLDLD
ncbi:MAG: hypothetical protein RLO50_12155 [Azospirillaceae bacterium]